MGSGQLAGWSGTGLSRPLPGVPGRNGVGLFRRERWENEVRIRCLPRQSLRFIDGKAKQMFRCGNRLAQFDQEGGLRLLNLRDELLAGNEANSRQAPLPTGIGLGWL